MITHQARLLIQGRETASAQTVFARLDELGIATHTFAHPPAFSLQESRSFRGEIPGTHMTHLFVRDHRQQLWLIACSEETQVEMDGLAECLRAWRLSLGSGRQLMEDLGVIPGTASLFAVLNDTACKVRVAIDRDLMDRRPWNLHPLDNGLTTSIDPSDMLRFLDAEEHAAELIELS